MTTAAAILPQLSMHNHASFTIERLSDRVVYSPPSLPSPATFLIKFAFKYYVRSYHYSASPSSQQEGNQILSIQYNDEAYGTEVPLKIAVPLDCLVSPDARASISFELRLFHLSECCQTPILNQLHSRFIAISNSGDCIGRCGQMHTVVRFDVKINYALCWRSNRDSLIAQLNSAPSREPEIESEAASTERRGLLQRAEREELDLMDGEDCSCAICLEKLTAKDEEVLRLPCSHVFHGGCILNWLKRRDSCPLCRFVLLPFPATGI